MVIDLARDDSPSCNFFNFWLGKRVCTLDQGFLVCVGYWRSGTHETLPIAHSSNLRFGNALCPRSFNLRFNHFPHRTMAGQMGK